MKRTKSQLKVAKRLMSKPKGYLQQIDPNNILSWPDWMTRAYRNNRYVVMIDDNARMTGGVIGIRAMVQRHDGKPLQNHWREMQYIKNEIFGKEAVGVEYFPAESELVDFCNIYWLWVLPAGTLPRPLNEGFSV